MRWFAALTASGKELLLADQRGAVYVVGVEREPMPHLAQRSRVVLDTPLASAAASNDRFAYAVDRQDRFVCLTLPDLRVATEEPLGGRPVRGPEIAGDAVFVEIEPDRFGNSQASAETEETEKESADNDAASDPDHFAARPTNPASGPETPAWRPVNELVCFGADGAFRWRVEIPPLVRLPMLTDGKLVAVSRDGFVVRLDQQSGAVLAREPLAASITSVVEDGSGSLLLGTRHGTVLRVPIP